MWRVAWHAQSSSALRPLDDVVDVDAELVEHEFAGCAGAEAVDPDRVVRPAFPTERGGGLDRQRRHAGGQDRVAEGSSCAAKRSQLGRLTTRTARPCSREPLGGVDADLDLAAGGDEHDVGVAVGVGHDAARRGRPPIRR